MKAASIRKYSAFLNIIIYLFFLGCGSVEQSIYLGNVEVNGPITTPPVHIDLNKNPGQFTISPRFSTVNKKNLKGSTDDRYISTFNLPDNTKYTTDRENLLWNFSEYSYGADIDFKISSVISIFGGITFSEGNSINSLTGGNVGLGFHNSNQNPVIRFDAGLNIQKYEYFAVTIVETKETSIFGNSHYTDIYGDKGESVNINPFFTLTFNSTNEKGLLNYYGTIGFFSQNLLDFKPGETNYPYFSFYEVRISDQRTNFTSAFFYLSPGLCFSLNPKIKLMATAKFLKNITIESSDLIIVPAVQMDFQL